MKKFWNWKSKKVRDQAGEEVSERVLFLNGTIAEESWFDDDVTPELFRSELNSGTGNITVWINSPGGDCVAAAQIYNMLMDYKGDVTVKVDGIAASAASVVAMAGTKVLMSPVSCMMIHNPATIAFGDTAEMQKAIDMLASVKDSIINAYEIKTGMSRTKISHMMDAETWMDAHKAVELGFADGILSREDAESGEAGVPGVTMLYSRASAMPSPSPAPSGSPTDPGTIKDPSRVRESWQATFGGSGNANKVAVLEEGMKYTPISISPEQAQFLETRKFQIDEIARIFRIPPHMIGDLEKSSFNNIEQQSLEFVKYTLDPWVSRWEQAMVRALLTPEEKRRYFFKFNVDGLLRGDYQGRMNGYATARQNGWMSANDIRELENLDRIPAEQGGDLYLVNGNMTRLEDAGVFAEGSGQGVGDGPGQDGAAGAAAGRRRREGG